ncbi:hypothetical protein R1sor_017243 [Riccia sorocarpa]|uniref:Uncharacterized protein n=1 Tax=Riccia sorocarpa TaxID=122646 RepID=A0ABD3IA92_9MARC
MLLLQSKLSILVWIWVAFATAERVTCISDPVSASQICSPKRFCYKNLIGREDRGTTDPGNLTFCKNCCTPHSKKRNSKPDCNHRGAVCYDPRFVGGDGVMFYYHGRKDETYCIVSDEKIHINAHFIGGSTTGAAHDFTWVQSLGLMFSTHTLSVGVRKVATWDDSEDHLEIRFDGRDIYLPQIDGALWASSAADVVVERTSSFNNAHIVIESLVEVTVSAVPVTEQELRNLTFNSTDQDVEDSFAHMNLQFQFLQLSNSTDGVLGQTYKPGYSTPIQSNSSVPVMSEEEKFINSSLLKSDCKVSHFSPPVDQAVNANTESVNLVTLDADPFELHAVQCPRSGLRALNCRR